MCLLFYVFEINRKCQSRLRYTARIYTMFTCCACALIKINDGTFFFSTLNSKDTEKNRKRFKWYDFFFFFTHVYCFFSSQHHFNNLHSQFSINILSNNQVFRFCCRHEVITNSKRSQELKWKILFN